MNRVIAIGLAVVLLAVAIPASAHQETNPDACSKRHSNGCQPQGNHAWCTGVRNAGAVGTDGAVRELDVLISQENVYTGVYVHTPSQDDSDDSGDDAGTPGILWAEYNGFSGLQKSNWNCKDLYSDEPDTTHSDLVLI